MLKDRIRELRKARGWTQEELAARAGMTQGVITNLERGARDNPTQETLDKLAGALGVPVSELLGEGDYLAGEFPVSQLDRDGVTAVLDEAFLVRYRLLWGRADRDQRARIYGHLLAAAQWERWLRGLEGGSAGGVPDGADDPVYDARLIPGGVEAKMQFGH